MRGARQVVGTSQTIVARATPPGRGGVAVIRMSGPATREILERLGAGRVLTGPPRTATLCRLCNERFELLDRGLVTFFPGPASYTGEDVGELSVHGGPAVVAAVLEAALSAGARLAEPGEFTRRAWLHGKLDRIQVEAVQDLIEAESPRLQRVAAAQLEGGLSRRLDALRQSLVRTLAAMAHHLDFPDEDEAPTPLDVLEQSLDSVHAGLAALLATAPEGRLLREGAVAVLAGRPNAGKSSLFNALVGEERVLVTPHPGTTRDAVEASISMGGWPVRLVDTAGVRGGGSVLDPVEAAGIELSRRWIGRADVVLWCRRASEGPPPATELEALVAMLPARQLAGDQVEAGGFRGAGVGFPQVLPVRTCADEVQSDGAEGPWPSAGRRPWLDVSARTGEGLEALRGAMAEGVFGEGGLGASEESGHILVRDRHRRLVRAALDEVEGARNVLSVGGGAELGTLHVEAAADFLSELMAPPADDEVLAEVFSSFCIGK